jgi:hypothetical protein
MEEPEEEAVEEPTTDEEQAEKEATWMAKEWVTIATVSILGLLLFALGLMQATGLVDVLAPIADTEAGQWLAFGVLALGAAALFVWGRHRV